MLVAAFAIRRDMRELYHIKREASSLTEETKENDIESGKLIEGNSPNDPETLRDTSSFEETKDVESGEELTEGNGPNDPKTLTDASSFEETKDIESGEELTEGNGPNDPKTLTDASSFEETKDIESSEELTEGNGPNDPKTLTDASSFLVWLLTMITGVCGMFLFSMMSAEEPNLMTLDAVGGLGGLTSLGIFFLEIVFSFNKEKRREETDEEKKKERKEDKENRKELVERMKAKKGTVLVNQKELGDRKEEISEEVKAEQEKILKEILKEILNFEGDLTEFLEHKGYEEEGWKTLEGYCPDVKMEAKYLEPEKGNRSVCMGKAETTVNCSMEEAAAWAFDFCSKERMRISREEGNPARCVWKKGEGNRENETTVATVKSSPSRIIDSREFVVRQFWMVKEKKIWIVFIDADDEVDYKTVNKKFLSSTKVPSKTTRASTKGYYCFEDIDAERCKSMLSNPYLNPTVPIGV
ncbi:hypothetical protein TrVE_jg4030 [Triparma verrucosa]|uniref:Uncharacterized protein n=1 Tax=Triparma verrucosa TaxID=1606542 RepID=A0A9W7C056_9STRA|nr:hypothetical protein TrVE_jg4030 [Triparma verrucosa]